MFLDIENFLSVTLWQILKSFESSQLDVTILLYVPLYIYILHLQALQMS